MADDCQDAAKRPGDPSQQNRRDIIIGGTGLLFGAALTAPTDASASKPPEKMPAQKGDRIQIVKGDLKDQLLKPELLIAGARPFEAFPFDPSSNVLRRKYRLNRMLVLRLDPSEMDEDTRALSINGVLVYSALCTHRACTIKSWMEEERHLRCHCHLSEFAALSGGSVRNGPAKRRLPMLPLALDDEGFIVATDGFNGRVGAAKK